MKRSVKWSSLILALVLLLSLMPGFALAESVHTINLNHAGGDAFEDHNYIEGRWIQLRASVPAGSDVEVSVYEDDHEDGSTAKRVFHDVVKGIEGDQYESKKIELKFVRSATVPYRVELRVDGELKRSGYVHRMLLALTNVTVCTRGIRFREVDNHITKEWMMFTPVRLHHIEDGGSMTLDLVASNMYLVGKLTIERDGSQYRFSLQDIDTWNQANGVDIPNGPHDVTDHQIDIRNVKIALYDSLDDVKSVKHGKMPNDVTLDAWTEIHGGNKLIYLNGDINYDPNQLVRDTDTYKSSYVQDLLDLMHSF